MALKPLLIAKRGRQGELVVNDDDNESTGLWDAPLIAKPGQVLNEGTPVGLRGTSVINGVRCFVGVNADANKNGLLIGIVVVGCDDAVPGVVRIVGQYGPLTMPAPVSARLGDLVAVVAGAITFDSNAINQLTAQTRRIIGSITEVVEEYPPTVLMGISFEPVAYGNCTLTVTLTSLPGFPAARVSVGDSIEITFDPGNTTESDVAALLGSEGRLNVVAEANPGRALEVGDAGGPFPVGPHGTVAVNVQIDGNPIDRKGLLTSSDVPYPVRDTRYHEGPIVLSNVNHDDWEDSVVIGSVDTHPRMAFANRLIEIGEGNDADGNPITPPQYQALLDLGAIDARFGLPYSAGSGGVPCLSIWIRTNGDITLVERWKFLQGDLVCSSIGSGIVLRSPNGSYHRIKVANDGTLSTEPVVI